MVTVTLSVQNSFESSEFDFTLTIYDSSTLDCSITIDGNIISRYENYNEVKTIVYPFESDGVADSFFYINKDRFNSDPLCGELTFVVIDDESDENSQPWLTYEDIGESVKVHVDALNPPG